MNETPWWFWWLVGYGIGSIPFGLLIGMTRGIDVRKHGSGNIGSTNVGRVLGRSWGLLCFVLDVLKGTMPVLLAGWAMNCSLRAELAPADAWNWLGVALASIVGHMFPVWLGFKGGKGVATGLGIMLGFWPLLTWVGIGGLLTWILLAGTFRYVSLASIVASLSLAVYLWVACAATDVPPSAMQPFFIITSLMAILVVIRHRSNMIRLWNGTESRLGDQK